MKIFRDFLVARSSSWLSVKSKILDLSIFGLLSHLKKSGRLGKAGKDGKEINEMEPKRRWNGILMDMLGYFQVIRPPHSRAGRDNVDDERRKQMKRSFEWALEVGNVNMKSLNPFLAFVTSKFLRALSNNFNFPFFTLLRIIIEFMLEFAHNSRRARNSSIS